MGLVRFCGIKGVCRVLAAESLIMFKVRKDFEAQASAVHLAGSSQIAYRPRDSKMMLHGPDESVPRLVP
jgi:hypothetical protein